MVGVYFGATIMRQLEKSEESFFEDCRQVTFQTYLEEQRQHETQVPFHETLLNLIC